MKLYLISRTDKVDWDEYESFVVAAENEENAINYYPDGKKLKDYFSNDELNSGCFGAWTTRENLEIECIGEAYSLEEKVIHFSFKRG